MKSYTIMFEQSVADQIDEIASKVAKVTSAELIVGLVRDAVAPQGGLSEGKKATVERRTGGQKDGTYCYGVGDV